MIGFGLERNQYWTGQSTRCDAFDLVIKTDGKLRAPLPRPSQINICGGS